MNMTTFHRSHSLGRSEKVEGFFNFRTDSTRGVHISVRRINVKHSNWLKSELEVASTLAFYDFEGCSPSSSMNVRY